MLNVAVAPAPAQLPVHSPVIGVADATLALSASTAIEAIWTIDLLSGILVFSWVEL